MTSMESYIHNFEAIHGVPGHFLKTSRSSFNWGAGGPFSHAVVPSQAEISQLLKGTLAAQQVSPRDSVTDTLTMSCVAGQDRPASFPS